jgi:hypothetical protein
MPYELTPSDLAERIGELLDEVAGFMTWILDYAEKNKIPLDNAFEFHLARIRSIIGEIAHPLSPSVPRLQPHNLLSQQLGSKDERKEPILAQTKIRRKVTAHLVRRRRTATIKS